jgi:hypothetical protein
MIRFFFTKILFKLINPSLFIDLLGVKNIEDKIVKRKIMKLTNEFEPIREWAMERGIFQKGDVKTQFIKTVLFFSRFKDDVFSLIKCFFGRKMLYEKFTKPKWETT